MSSKPNNKPVSFAGMTVDQKLEAAQKRFDHVRDNGWYWRILFYDWPNWEEHLNWLLTAPPVEIYQWALGIHQQEMMG